MDFILLTDGGIESEVKKLTDLEKYTKTNIDGIMLYKNIFLPLKYLRE